MSEYTNIFDRRRGTFIHDGHGTAGDIGHDENQVFTAHLNVNFPTEEPWPEGGCFNDSYPFILLMWN